MSDFEDKQDDNEITVIMNKYDYKKDKEYRFLSPNEATLDIITELLTNAGAEFIAVEQESISQKECHIVYACPEFVNLTRLEPHTEKANKFESLIIDDKKYLLKLTEIENRDTDNRIVLYDEAEKFLRDCHDDYHHQRFEVNSRSGFANMDMAEVYGRLSETLEIAVEHRKHPSRILIHDGEHVLVGIEAQGESLSARGRTKFDDIEIEANAKRVTERIKNALSSTYSNTRGVDV